jgi:hypothetical protein
MLGEREKEREREKGDCIVKPPLYKYSQQQWQSGQPDDRIIAKHIANSFSSTMHPFGSGIVRVVVVSLIRGQLKVIFF